MTKIIQICLMLAFSALLISAQRPPNPTPAPATDATGSIGPAATGAGTNAADPNITNTINNTNINGIPTTNTVAANSTSVFSLDRLKSIQQTNTANSSYPTQDYTLFLADIHFYAGNLSSQYIAYHFCSFISADFMQCALYNGRQPDSRFIGNEYFITQTLFENLPEVEKNLWHAHPFEVQSGLFIAPDLSPEDDLAIAQWLMGTFGKVTDTWQYYYDFPIGPPQVGIALSLASQVNWTLATQMDEIFALGTTYQQRQQQRAGLVAPQRSAGSDNYIFTGYATTYEIYSFPVENNATLLGFANATGTALSNQTAPVGTNITLPASNVSLANLPTSSPQAGPDAFSSLPNPFAPTLINLPLPA